MNKNRDQEKLDAYQITTRIQPVFSEIQFKFSAPDVDYAIEYKLSSN